MSFKKYISKESISKFPINHFKGDIIIIDKPAGIVMHPGAGNYNKTLVNALIFYDKDSR